MFWALSVASARGDLEEQAGSQEAWVLIPALSLNHFMIQDFSFNHSVPQFPHLWLHPAYLLHGVAEVQRRNSNTCECTLAKVLRSIVMIIIFPGSVPLFKEYQDFVDI